MVYLCWSTFVKQAFAKIQFVDATFQCNHLHVSKADPSKHVRWFEGWNSTPRTCHWFSGGRSEVCLFLINPRTRHSLNPVLLVSPVNSSQDDKIRIWLQFHFWRNVIGCGMFHSDQWKCSTPENHEASSQSCRGSETWLELSRLHCRTSLKEITQYLGSSISFR